MKKLILTLLCVLLATPLCLAQQPRYLVNTIKPNSESRLYSSVTGSNTMFMGGVEWKNGFKLGQQTALIKSEDLGHVVFRLNASYEKMTFVCGAVQSKAAFNSINNNTGVLCIYADGRKIFDQKISSAMIGERFTLDVTGAVELKFQVLVNMVQVGVAEIALWKAGETPRETGSSVVASSSRKQLMKDIMPYIMPNNHKSINSDSSVKVGNKSYSNALVMDMSMPISGENSGTAFFNIDRRFKTLVLTAGPVNEQNSNNAKGWITIKGDGKILHEYEIKQDDIAKSITVNVQNIKQLSIQSDQSKSSMKGAVVEAFLYPEGVNPPQQSTSEIDPRLKSLPDACKLISNIAPYSTRSSLDKQVYNGESDYITFSMGGVRFSEGFIMYKNSSFLDSDQTSYAAFDLGGEFDYLTMTLGFVGKSWAMTNDAISVYADEELIKTIPVFATMQNIRLTLPIGKCRKLRIQNAGSGKMSIGAYGVGDMVVWRGEPGDDNLFYHDIPDCPHDIDLIDLGAPYIHYVSSMGDNKENMYYDGTTQRHYVTMRDGTRINKGFVLKTDVHFSLDYGVLSGMDSAMGAVAGAVAAGVSFVPIASVGGVYAGASLAGAAALLVLAAGGEAVENSCAAFNTYGEYNSLTFTVACLRTREEAQLLGKDTIGGNDGDYKEHLLIGSNQQVIAEMAVYEEMAPQTITVPIEGCKQLMFWLANTHHTSAVYFFYDLKLSKDRCVMDIPDEAKLSKPYVDPVQWHIYELKNNWEVLQKTGLKYLDEYLRDLSNLYSNVQNFMKSYIPYYEKYTYYLSTRDGDVVKGVKLRDTKYDSYSSIPDALLQAEKSLKKLSELRYDVGDVSLSKVNAYLDLPSLGLGAVSMSKTLKYSSKVLSELKSAVDTMYNDMLAFRNDLSSITSTALDVDGRKTTDNAIICPLSKDETVPDGDRMLVENFNL